MELITLPYLKQLIGKKESDTTDDALLQNLIEAVSKQAERYLNRVVQTAQQTEYFDVADGDTVFQLASYPITTINGTGEGVWNDATWDFATATSSDSYRVNTATGLLYFLVSPYRGLQALKVIYTGGMATTTEKLAVNYPDLAQAIARQTAYLFNTRHQIGAVAVNVGESSVSWAGDVVWLEGVKAVLDTHRRLQI